MRMTNTIAILIVLSVSFYTFADETAEKPKTRVTGVETVTDAAAALVKKSEALISMNLEIDMSPKKPVPKNQYTFNALVHC
jgi:hypothetical protein